MTAVFTSLRPRKRHAQHAHLGLRATAAIQTTRGPVALCRWRDAIFTRSSNGTYVNPSTGLVKTVGNNVSREERLGVLPYLGLLIERPSTNQILFSEQFDHVVWSGAAAATANAAAAPDGATTADRITIAAPGEQKLQFPAVASHTASVWAKKGTQGVLASVGQSTTRQFTPDADSWRRFVAATSTSSSASMFVNPDGVASDNHLFWGAQNETLAWASSYILTTGATASRSADLVDMAVAQCPNALLFDGFRFLFKPNWIPSNVVDGTVFYLLAFDNGFLRFSKSGGVTTLVAATGTESLSVAAAITAAVSWSDDAILEIEVRPSSGYLSVRVVGTSALFESSGGSPWRWTHGARTSMRVGNSFTSTSSRAADGLVGDPFPLGASLW